MISKLKRKIKNLKVLVKIKKARWNESLSEVARVRSALADKIRQQEESRNAYLTSVSDVNQMRLAGDIRSMEIFGSGIDQQKSGWVTSYQEMKKLNEILTEKEQDLVSRYVAFQSATKLLDEKERELRIELGKPQD